MKIWITGSRGFVGRRLVKRLREEAIPCGDPAQEIDVTQPDAIEAHLEAHRPETIVHLAGISFIPQAAQDPLQTWRVNFSGSAHLLRACADIVPQARILIITTGAIYGTAETHAPPFDEDSPLRPEGPYATSKAAADLLAEEWERRGLNIVRLRPFNHTGAGRPEHFVESSFARQLVEMERGRRDPVLRVGNLASERDFLHVEDVVDAYLKLLRPDAPRGIFNIASGRRTKIQQLLDLLIQRSDVSPNIEIDPERMRPTDASVGSAQKLQQATGWQPRHSLEDILQELLEDWRRQLSSP